MNETISGLHNQILRGRILKICRHCEAFEGAGTEIIKMHLKKEGYGVTESDILKAFEYLEQKGLIAVKTYENKYADVKRTICRLLPKGTDVLEGTLPIEGIEL